MSVAEQVREKVVLKVLPNKVEILIMNDDYTTVEFVIRLLKNVFNKSDAVARALTEDVHTSGQGSCGIYTSEIGWTLFNQAKQLIAETQFPLKLQVKEL